MATPSVLEALLRSARATRRAAWLAPVGLAVGLVRLALLAPAQLFVAAALGRAAAWGVARHGLGLRAAPRVESALLAAASPRFVALAIALWASGALLAGALRVAWLSGALPTVGRELAGGGAGAASEHAFAPGVAWGFVHLLPAAVLALVLELVAGLVAAAAIAATALAAVVGAGRAHPVAAAILGAATLTGSLLAMVAAGGIADATVARAALRGEGPARALARAAIRFGRRPAAFVAIALAAIVTDLVLAGSARGLAAAGAGAPTALVALGPQLMASVAVATLGILVELWRLGASAILACHD